MDKEQDHLQDTESRILQAAENEFFEKGYAGARDKLFERIVSEKISMLADILLSAIGDANLPLEERIRQGIGRHFDFISANRDLPRFIVNEVLSRPEQIDTMKGNIQNIVNELLDNLQQEIDEYAAKGLCRQVDARMLLIDIVSLNVFPFMAAPIVYGAIGDSYGDYDEFLAIRKKENVETILNKLKIH